jgi:antitoxin component HigA of HigAB toxin-antitoxin module
MARKPTYSDNPVAAYAEGHAIGPTEMAKRLGLGSKGAASELMTGKRKIGLSIARRMEKLTGRPWHEFVTGAAE